MDIKDLAVRIREDVIKIQNMQRPDLEDTQRFANWNSFTIQFAKLGVILKRSDPKEVCKYNDILKKMLPALHDAEVEIKEMVAEENQEAALDFYHRMDTALQDYCRTLQLSP